MASRAEIEKAYQDILGRAPDKQGLDYWLGQDVSVERLRAVMADSPEGREALAQAYQDTLGRAPDAQGLEYWTEQLVSGVSLTRAREVMAASPEATSQTSAPAQPGTTLGSGTVTGGQYGWTNPTTIDYAAEERKARAPGANPNSWVDNTLPAPSTGASTPAEMFQKQASAPVEQGEYAVLKQLLTQFGLESIYDKVRQFITADSSGAEIELAMREMPEYRDRFRVIFEREEAGLPPISAADVVNYESQLQQVMSYYGVPENPGENLQDTAAELLGGDVSMTEVQQRLTSMAAFGRAVLDDPNQDQAVVQGILGNGGTLFDVANFALDPEKTIEQIERRLVAAEIANEASQANYGRLSADEAMELSRAGVTGQQAQQGFGVLNQSQQVVNRIVGDRDDPVSREQELAAIAGDVNAQAAIERSAQKRVAAFQVGGQFATDDEGFGGLR